MKCFYNIKKQQAIVLVGNESLIVPYSMFVKYDGDIPEEFLPQIIEHNNPVFAEQLVPFNGGFIVEFTSGTNGVQEWIKDASELESARQKAKEHYLTVFAHG